MEHTRIPIIYDHYKWKMMRNQQKPDKPTFLGGKEDAEIQAM
jgi:glucuronate isomerase